MTMDGAPILGRYTDAAGKRIQLEVQPTDSVDDVRRMIEKIEGTSPGEN